MAPTQAGGSALWHFLLLVNASDSMHGTRVVAECHSNTAATAAVGTTGVG